MSFFPDVIPGQEEAQEQFSFTCEHCGSLDIRYFKRTKQACCGTCKHKWHFHLVEVARPDEDSLPSESLHRLDAWLEDVANMAPPPDNPLPSQSTTITSNSSSNVRTERPRHQLSSRHHPDSLPSLSPPPSLRHASQLASTTVQVGDQRMDKLNIMDMVLGDSQSHQEKKKEEDMEDSARVVPKIPQDIVSRRVRLANEKRNHEDKAASTEALPRSVVPSPMTETLPLPPTTSTESTPAPPTASSSQQKYDSAKRRGLKYYDYALANVPSSFMLNFTVDIPKKSHRPRKKDHPRAIPSSTCASASSTQHDNRSNPIDLTDDDIAVIHVKKGHKTPTDTRVTPSVSTSILDDFYPPRTALAAINTSSQKHTDAESAAAASVVNAFFEKRTRFESSRHATPPVPVSTTAHTHLQDSHHPRTVTAPPSTSKRSSDRAFSPEAASVPSKHARFSSPPTRALKFSHLSAADAPL
ncbi:hypothetical protein BC940DRAFT_368896 [Gongronella butleri]|nr:hypothetical protein BC940DRAFT_368896 [Gongronella butleri]